MQHSSHLFEISWNSGRLGPLRRCIATAIDQSLQDREQWALWMPVLIAAGVGAFFFRQTDPGWFEAFAPLAVLLVCLSLRYRNSTARTVFLAGICMALGYFITHISGAISGHAPIDRSTVLFDATGIVRSVHPGSHSTRFRLSDVRDSMGRPVATGAIDLNVSNRILDGNDSFRQVRFDARIAPPEAPAIPGGYDPQRRAWFNGVSARGYAWQFEKLNDPDTAFAVISDLRQRIARSLRSVMPERSAEIAVALTIGERRGIWQQDIDNLRISGLAHLLAISGLHIGLVTGMTFFVLRAGLALSPRMALYYPIKKLAAFTAMPVAFLYMLLAGATVPTQRAFIMTAIMLLAVLVDRRAISLRLVAIAATLVLLSTPFALTGPSFQMSFAAVTVIVAVYEQAGEKVRLKLYTDGDPSLARRAFRWVSITLGTTLVSTLAAGLATAPFATYHFGQFALYGLLANMLAVPIAAYIVMPSLLLFVLLLPFGTATPIAVVVNWGIRLMLDWAEFVAGLPHAAISGLSLPFLSLVSITLGGLWILIWRQKMRYAGLLLMLLATVPILYSNKPIVIIEETGKWIALRSADYGIRSAGQGRLSEYMRHKLDITLDNDIRAPDVSCDLIGCRFSLSGQQFAFAIQGQALQEDCRNSDILISAEPVPWSCRGPDQIIDRFDLWRHGAHAVYRDGKEIRIITVHDKQGCRHWSKRRPACRLNDQ